MRNIKHCSVKYSVYVYLYNSAGIPTTQRNGRSRKRDAVGEKEKKFLMPLKPPDQFLNGISLLLNKKIYFIPLTVKWSEA